MMHTIDQLDYDELLALRNQIKDGRVLEHVEAHISKFENPNRVCPVCSTPVDPERAITLYFGPVGLRQRASFDGEDCLRHFVQGTIRFKKE